MKSYQIGNKVTGIIRAFCPCEIGNYKITYDNEPYTVLKDVTMSLSFTDKEKNATDRPNRELNFNVAELNQIRLTNVHLTDKILALLFKPYKNALCTHTENVETDEYGKVYLTTNEQTIYQVFVYKDDSQLDCAFGTVEVEDFVLEPDTSYLIIYQTLSSDALCLSSPQNLYFTLDFICEGNTNDETAPAYIHIQKAGLRIDKNMYFNGSLNAVDLTFNVITTTDDYIVLD